MSLHITDDRTTSDETFPAGAAPGAHAGRVPAAPRPRGRLAEPPQFCPCGQAPATVAGLCRPCYDRLYHSTTHFAGQRFAALERDGFRCRVCTSADYPIVHHRDPETEDLDRLITLCASCHGVVTHLEWPTGWLPPLLLALWREQHPDDLLQTQFAFDDWTPPPPPAVTTFGPDPAAAGGPPPDPIQGALFPAAPDGTSQGHDHESLYGPRESRRPHPVA